MDGLAVKLGIQGMVPPPISSAAAEVRVNPTQVSAIGRSTAERSATATPQKLASPPGSRFSFRYPLTSLWRGGGNQRHGGLEAAEEVAVDGGEERGMGSAEGQNGNWVAKILQLNSIWRDKQRKKGVEEVEKEAVDDRCGGQGEEGCEICGAEDEEEVEFDRDSFSRLLRRVSLTDAKLYAQMSYLGNLAYSIPSIKPRNLLKYRGLRFVTSSIEKKELAAKADKELAEKDHPLAEIQEPEEETKEGEEEGEEEKRERYQISALAAYKIAASAASYLHSQTKSMLPFKSKAGEGSSAGGYENADRVMLRSAEVASLKATTDSMTAVVAAKEEEKQAVANNLNSTRSTPCEWFICDDDQTATRFFVIQGSESLESWQANLLFEPVQFEGLGVLVHRGIYEAAKGIYEQMLPEVRAHLKSHGKRATVRFTGHSLGGSLSLLINLMLLIRGEVPLSSLLPVVTFGAPSIMCGGDRLLQKLGLPRSHVQAITLHRDIVPRAFSCSYPNHIVELLKAVNGNFRNHPCLHKQNLLYAPMGELLILQPDEKMSPHHHLLPSGSGMFFLSCALSDLNDAERQVQAAKMVFLNSPHPLEILSDRSAYGSEGTIQRDHDMNSYYKSVRHVILEELKGIRKAERAQRREVWWPLVNLNRFNAGVIMGRQVSTVNLSGALRTGRETLTRLGRFAASQQMHLFVVLLFPARLLLLGAYNVFNFR